MRTGHSVSVQQHKVQAEVGEEEDEEAQEMNLQHALDDVAGIISLSLLCGTSCRGSPGCLCTSRWCRTGPLRSSTSCRGGVIQVGSGRQLC